MIFTARCGKTFLASVIIPLLLASCSGKAPAQGAETDAEKRVKEMIINSYSDSILTFTLSADSGRSADSSGNFMLYAPVYERKSGEKVTVESDSCLSGKQTISYFGGVTVRFEDSMILYTDSMVYLVREDSASTGDSVLIEKEKNKMKTRGFSAGEGFKRIVFPDKVVLYGD